MQETASRSAAGRLVASAVGVFLVAILMARFLLAPGGLWQFFLVAVPILLIVLSLAFGFVRAMILVAMFAATVLATRWVIETPGVGWAVLLLAPLLAIAMLVGLRVARALLRPGPPAPGVDAGAETKEVEGKEEGNESRGH